MQNIGTENTDKIEYFYIHNEVIWYGSIVYHIFLSKLEPHLKELGKEKQQQKWNLKTNIMCPHHIYYDMIYLFTHSAAWEL